MNLLFVWLAGRAEKLVDYNREVMECLEQHYQFGFSRGVAWWWRRLQTTWTSIISWPSNKAHPFPSITFLLRLLPVTTPSNPFPPFPQPRSPSNFSLFTIFPLCLPYFVPFPFKLPPLPSLDLFFRPLFAKTLFTILGLCSFPLSHVLPSNSVPLLIFSFIVALSHCIITYFSRPKNLCVTDIPPHWYILILDLYLSSFFVCLFIVTSYS